MERYSLLLLFLPTFSSIASAQDRSVGDSGAMPLAAFEDYREPAGVLSADTLRLALAATPAAWQPWGREGPAVPAHVFAIEGEPPKIPGPMIRVRAGTPVAVTVRNALSDTLVVRGLRDRGQDPVRAPAPGRPAFGPFVGDSLVIAPGETREARFTPEVTGTYYYFGKTFEPGWSATPQQLFGGAGPDRGLVGVLIVDEPDAIVDPAERILLISHWAEFGMPSTWLPATRFVINGRAWPHTERLEYTQGDTVRWRVINQSGKPHPMHLHGFYFHVDAMGSQGIERVFAPAERPFVVTQPLAVNASMRMSFVVHEPGNWIFHCHLMRHMSQEQHPTFDGVDAAHAHDDGDDAEQMGGLVMGIHVHPREGYEPPSDAVRRALTLHIGKRDRVFGDEPGYAFVLQDGASAPAPDSVHFPGSPIVLTRGEPAAITVRNHADVALGVHWHGLELESRGDGVPGWSGMPGAAVPAIAPRDSLTVRITPPRAGTFMYHVHSEPGHQLAQGLYGAFLVLEPGEPWDRDRDRIFLLGSLGSGDDPPPAVNGALEPQPLEMRAGETYRLRFMHISPNDEKRVSLLDGEASLTWRHIAKDGATLPPARAREGPAEQTILVGETYDFLVTPAAPGTLNLRIVTTFDAGAPAFPRRAPPPHTVNIPIVVR